jgi:hypothetical protein
MGWFLPLIVLAGLLAFPCLVRVVNRYLLFPWRSRYESPAVGPGYVAIEIASASPDAAARLAETARELARCGFVAAAHFRIEPPAEMPQREAYLSIWLNEPDAIVCRAIWVRISRPDVRLVMTSFAVSFATTFDDGGEIVTTNAPTVSLFPPDRKTDLPGWKDMNHASVLYKLHRARTERAR